MSRFRKAVMAALAAAAAALVQAIRSGAALDGETAAIVVGAAIVAGLATYRVPNAAPAGGGDQAAGE